MPKNKNYTIREQKFRAYCHSCDFTGEWHEDPENARRDARIHNEQFPGHDTDIEVNQSFLTRFRPEEST